MLAKLVVPAQAGAALLNAMRQPLAAPACAGATACFGVRHAR